MNKKNEKAEKKSEIKKVETKKVSTLPKKKKVKKNITSGIAFVYSTFNNTIITIADERALKAQENQLLTLHKSLRTTQVQKLLNKD